MKIKGRLFYLINIILIVCGNCKIPESPKLGIDDIIIHKGKYIYSIQAGSGSLPSSYDTFVMQIDTVLHIGDSTIYLGNSFIKNNVDGSGNPRLYPLRIERSATHIFLKTQSEYIVSGVSFISNFLFEFPIEEQRTYSDNICDYIIKFDPANSRYTFNGKAYSNAWYCSGEFDMIKDNAFFYHKFSLTLSPDHFIVNMNINQNNTNGSRNRDLNLVRIETQ